MSQYDTIVLFLNRHMIDENNQKQKFQNSKLAVNRRASDGFSNTFLTLKK